MNSTELPAHQARSRHSRKRLLKAAIDTLNTLGLDGATIPRIAKRAGLSPGTVYRRFPDKDSLLREVCVRLLEDSYENAKEQLKPERWAGVPLAVIMRTMIEKILQGNSANRRLFRAYSLFTLQHSDPKFVKQVDELQWRVFLDFGKLLMTRRDEISHSDPESAIKFALLTVGLMGTGVFVLPSDPQSFFTPLPDVQTHVERELPEMILRYLGVREGS